MSTSSTPFANGRILSPPRAPADAAQRGAAPQALARGGRGWWTAQCSPGVLQGKFEVVDLYPDTTCLEAYAAPEGDGAPTHKVTYLK